MNILSFRPSFFSTLLLVFFLLLSGSALSLGSVYTNELALFAFLTSFATIAFCAYHIFFFRLKRLFPGSTPQKWMTASYLRFSHQANVILFLGSFLLFFTFIQLIVLPAPLLHKLSPLAYKTWTNALKPQGIVLNSYFPLSLDPTATRVELLRGLLYVTLFTLSLAFLTFSPAPASAKRWLEHLLLICPIVMAVTMGIAPIFGSTKVLFLYDPLTPKEGHIAPLLNPNHLAGYLNIGLLVALADFFSKKPKRVRWVNGVAFSLLFIAQMFCASRGGMMSFFLGVLSIFFFISTRSLQKLKRYIVYLAPVFIFCAVAATLIFTQFDAPTNELFQTETSKLDLIYSALRFSLKAPWFGVGRGAFQSAFTQEVGIPHHYIWTHPENMIAQWACEWGFPTTIFALVLLIYGLWPNHDVVNQALGPWTALFALALHNLVDFSSEIPGVMLLLCVCAAIVTSSTRRPSDRTSQSIDKVFASSPSQKRKRFLYLFSSSFSFSTFIMFIFTLSSVMAALSLICFRHRHEEVDEERLVLSKRLKNFHHDPSFSSALERAMRIHPAESYFPYLGALHAQLTHSGVDQTIRFADRALTLSPIFGQAHLLLARTFFSLHPSQARLEYRLALEQDRSTSSFVVSESSQLISSYDDVLDLIPTLKKENVMWAEQLRGSIKERLPVTSKMIEQELIQADQNQAIVSGLNDILHDVSHHEVWCDQDQKLVCLDEGKELSKRLIKLKSESCLGALYTLKFILLDDENSIKKNADISSLERDLKQKADRSFCIRDYILFLRERSNRNSLKSHLENLSLHLSQMLCDTTDECLQNDLFLAWIAESDQNFRSALVYLRAALAKAPTREDILTKAATLASQTGLHAEAASFLEKLLLLQPENKEYQNQLHREKASANPQVRDFGHGN